MYLDNIERTSSTSSEQLINSSDVASLHPLWTFNATGGKQGIQSQVVEVNGIVYFGASSGYEYALDATNGSLVWKAFLGQAKNDTGCGGTLGVTSTAAIENGTLYVDGGYPYFYALNATTGAFLWSVPIGNGTSTQGFYQWSSPLLYDGNAYVGLSSQCDKPLVQAGVDEISLASHAIDGYLDTSQPAVNGSSIWSSPSVNPATNTIYVTTGNQYRNSSPTRYSESVLALNATTLAVEASWQVPPAQAVGDSDFGTTATLFTPTGGYPMLTAANKNGYLYAYYQSNLTLAWETRICCKASAQDEHISTAYGDGQVYAVSSITKFGGHTYNSSVRAFNPLTGAILWQVGFPETSFYGYAAPVYFNGLLLVADENTVFLFNASTGAVLYQDNVSGIIEAGPSIARGEIYVTSSANQVTAFDVRLAGSISASPSTGAAPLVVNFSGAGMGGLPPYQYAWTFGDGGASDLQSPSHTFASPGAYVVTLTVTDLAGSRATTSWTESVESGYVVNFIESGLPPSTAWSVSLDGSTASSSSARVGFLETNGTYSYAIPNVPGYSATPGSGNVTVAGAAASVSVVFTPDFNVTFLEVGLPLGTNWSVTLGGALYGSNTSSIVASEPNGTYNFRVGIVAGWTTQGTGTVTVHGSPVERTRHFVPYTYTVKIVERGLPAGTAWSATVGNQTVSGTQGSMVFVLPNGTYAFSIGAVAGFVTPASGTVQVAGSVVILTVHYSPVVYKVTFVEHGLPKGATWQVSVGHSETSGSGRTLSLNFANGSYLFTSSTAGTNLSVSPGSFSVDGGPATVPVNFSLAPGGPSDRPSGLTPEGLSGPGATIEQRRGRVTT